MRYKVWRSNKDKCIHLLCGEGAEAFEALPTAIRNLGPWTGGPEGEINRLRLPYRAMLAEHAFVVICAPLKQLQLEVVASVHVLHPATTKCPECKGKKRVPMYHGLRDEDLRDKECPRCDGRGWVKSKPGG